MTNEMMIHGVGDENDCIGTVRGQTHSEDGIFFLAIFSLGVSFFSGKEELDDDTKGDENDGIASERCEGRNNLPPEGKRSAGSPANTSYSTILQPRYIASLSQYCSPDILRHSYNIAAQIYCITHNHTAS